VFTHGLQFDDVEKRVLRVAAIYPRSSVSCAAVTLRTRFTAFADHVAHSRPLANTRPIDGLAARAAPRAPNAGISGRGRLRSTPRLRRGKRASEASASTSVNAFELR
jgi:hypothetical protein